MSNRKDYLYPTVGAPKRLPPPPSVAANNQPDPGASESACSRSVRPVCATAYRVLTYRWECGCGHVNFADEIEPEETQRCSRCLCHTVMDPIVYDNGCVWRSSTA